MFLAELKALAISKLLPLLFYFIERLYIVDHLRCALCTGFFGFDKIAPGMRPAGDLEDAWVELDPIVWTVNRHV